MAVVRDQRGIEVAAQPRSTSSLTWEHDYILGNGYRDQQVGYPIKVFLADSENGRGCSSVIYYTALINISLCLLIIASHEHLDTH